MYKVSDVVENFVDVNKRCENNKKIVKSFEYCDEAFQYENEFVK